MWQFPIENRRKVTIIASTNRPLPRRGDRAQTRSIAFGRPSAKYRTGDPNPHCWKGRNRASTASGSQTPRIAFGGPPYVVASLGRLLVARAGGLLQVLGPPRDPGNDRDSRPPPRDVVMESARQIPVLYDVDVLVVGGTSGAVTAAVAAAQDGATVFLAAPRPYLGDDICGTYRLWLEPGEEPMVAVGQDPVRRAGYGRRQFHDTIPFTYQADIASSTPHKDSPRPSLLGDGKWQSARVAKRPIQRRLSISSPILGSEQFITERPRDGLSAYQRLRGRRRHRLRERGQATVAAGGRGREQAAWAGFF